MKGFFQGLLLGLVVLAIVFLMQNGLLGVTFNPGALQATTTMAPPVAVTMVNGTPVIIVVTSPPGPGNDVMATMVANLQPSLTPMPQNFVPTVGPSPTLPSPFYDTSAQDADVLKKRLESQLEGYKSNPLQIAVAMTAMDVACANGSHLASWQVDMPFDWPNYTIPSTVSEVSIYGCSVIYAGFNLRNMGETASYDYTTDGGFQPTGLISSTTGQPVYQPSATVTLKLNRPCIAAVQPQIQGLEFVQFHDANSLTKWISGAVGKPYSTVGFNKLALSDWNRNILTSQNLNPVLNESVASAETGVFAQVLNGIFDSVEGLRSVKVVIDVSNESAAIDLATGQYIYNEPSYCSDGSPVIIP